MKYTLDLSKIPITPDSLSPSMNHFSAVDDPTGLLPAEKMSPELALVEPGVGEVLRKSSIHKLSERNEQIIDNLLGTGYVERSYNDNIKANEFIEANVALSEHLYGSEVARLVWRNDKATLYKMQLDVIDAVSAPELSLDDIDMSRLGVVVVRPEALELADQSRISLERFGLRIVFDKNIQIDFRQYWSLYGPGLCDTDAKYDFPTRTLNYINQDIRVLVVAANPVILNTASVSDYINDKLKGRQGSYARNTLRGDIAYTALRGLVNIDSSGFVNKLTNLALDPIGAYRQLVRGGIPSDRMHSTADSPILFYAGQAVHIPNNREIARDIRVLLSEEDIVLIAESVNKTMSTDGLILAGMV